MEAADRIPYSFCELGILQQTVSAWGVKWAHAHVHARKGEDPPQPLRPKVFTRAVVDALKRM
jgi:hypothetical protein